MGSLVSLWQMRKSLAIRPLTPRAGGMWTPGTDIAAPLKASCPALDSCSRRSPLLPSTRRTVAFLVSQARRREHVALDISPH
jgi:hypothetical protein